MKVFEKFAKRLMDVLVAGFLLLVLSPILLAIGIWIKFDSLGPALFLQERVGQAGNRFKMFKFRSMVDGAHMTYEEVREKNDQSLNGPYYKDRLDPRITRFGKFLRTSSIDELPQLLNVLSGDMSLVGPRPAFELEINKMTPQQLQRLSVKPGLTGLWQVSGRSLLPFEEGLQLDLHYVENASIWLDLKILLKTIPAVASRKGAF